MDIKYESSFKKRRRRQRQQAAELYKTLKGKYPMGSIWAMLEDAVGLSRQTIKKDLKEVGLYGNEKG